jgi:sugar phosphate isomerase/epimerase
MIRNCFPQLAQVVIKNNSPSTNIYNYRTKYSPSLNGYAYPNKELIFDNLKRYVKLQTKINNVQDRLIVSNLAWDTVWEDHALDILTKYGITGVELAVTKYTPWDKINREVLLNIKDRFAKRGIAIHSLQAIFFGVIDNVFTEETTFTEHFKTVIMCAGVLGAKRIVFGSPRNRVKPDNMPLDYADANFINVMRKLAIYARTYDVIICLEPNAVEYKCNYITHIDHAIHIVKSVDHANLKLNFDTGNALMSGELSVEKFMEVAPYVGHIQVSLPFLDELRKLSDYDEIHRALSDAFKKQECFVSLEMKQVAKYNQFIENISKFVWLYA